MAEAEGAPGADQEAPGAGAADEDATASDAEDAQEKQRNKDDVSAAIMTVCSIPVWCRAACVMSS